MLFSAFGEKISADAGILSLMDDLGLAMTDRNAIMMGGGNPGYIEEIQNAICAQLQKIIADPQALHTLIGLYSPPNGDLPFREALAALLRRQYGWDLSAENICLTSGSQSAFFLLFNLFGGVTSQGQKRKILLPIAPEYIGYADLGITEDFFVSFRPHIEELGPHLFKYRVNFEELHIGPDVAAICVSRPTNPTGNVLTDDEIRELARLAAEHDIPLIVDNAYGLPFPGMIYTDAKPLWDKHLILCMSLSKLGLPAVRTGIIIADKPLIRRIAGANAVVNLAPTNFGPMLLTDLIRSGEILRLSKEVIGPFYHHKMELALQAIEEQFTGFPYKVHVPEGAMFLWVWFPGLPVSSRVLYERLKKRGVVVVSGDYFFPGLEPGWQHTQECLRVTYAQDEADVRRGIGRIAEEVRDLFATGA